MSHEERQKAIASRLAATLRAAASQDASGNPFTGEVQPSEDFLRTHLPHSGLSETDVTAVATAIEKAVAENDMAVVGRIAEKVLDFFPLVRSIVSLV